MQAMYVCAYLEFRCFPHVPHAPRMPTHIARTADIDATVARDTRLIGLYAVGANNNDTPPRCGTNRKPLLALRHVPQAQRSRQ